MAAAEPDPTVTPNSPAVDGPAGGRVRDHAPFLVLLALGLLVRVAVQVSFSPAFVFSDGPVYLAQVDHLVPLQERVVGYGFVLHALAWLTRDVWLIAVVQHLLGLATAVLAYAFLRHWRVGRWAAALATAPVLFDAMQLVLEHSVLSDTVFDLMVTAGIVLLAWQPTPRPGVSLVGSLLGSLVRPLAGGLMLGAAVCVRVVGQPLVVAAAVFCLLALLPWWSRLLRALAVVAAFALPGVGYAAWYHAEHDHWAMSESGGRALYMRTTAWVDCTRFEVPAYQRTLCPAEPLGQRIEPTVYGWHSPDRNAGLTPPPGTTPNQAMRDFAVAAIQAQPGDYARTVLRDIGLNFWTPRIDRYEYDTADKWSFERYLDLPATSYTRPAYEAHGGELPSVREPWASAVVRYGDEVFLRGPALLGLALLSVLSLTWRDRPGAPPRAVIVMLLLCGVGLMVAPDVTAEFVWRYQLPAVLLVPIAAALGWARTRATPSTD